MEFQLLAQREARDRHFSTSILLPKPIDDVFRFFSDAHNLERITPPWLNFRIKWQSTSQIEKGTLLEYRLRVHSIPLTWRTEIVEWEVNRRFVDTQVRGPYQKWRHLHLFFAEGEQTRMQDEVLYRLPLGSWGDRIAGWWVDRDVKAIFDYRADVIRKIFAK